MASISPPITAITGMSATGGVSSGLDTAAMGAVGVSGLGGSMLGREDMGMCANAAQGTSANRRSEAVDDTADSHSLQSQRSGWPTMSS